DPVAELPGWVAAIAARLDVFARGTPGARRARRALRRTLAVLRARLAKPEDGAAALPVFCEACLVLLESAVAARHAPAPLRRDFARLCALARAELAGGVDDRPLLAAVRALEDLPHPVPWAAMRVPGRVVFLASIAARMPSEEAAAATMLVNDLATLGPDLPRAALEVAAGRRRLRWAG
ncbi:hypothetical protein, partial [Neoroseomonas rubea]|uniref:hypothetical protein n=1 Tax=Neoroseomonas rubea TaxID=2748666 RepID=UPI0018DFFB79